MFRTYALAPDTVRRFLRRMFWRFQSIVTLSFLAFGVYLAWFAGPIQWGRVLPIVGIIALVYFFVIFFNYRQQMRLLYSIRYELDGSSIVYRQLGREPLRIMRPEVVHAQQRRDGLWIQVVDESHNLLVLNGLARGGDQDFLQTLDAWVGVDRLPKKKMNWLWLLSLGVVIALAILIFANTLWIILPLGAFFFLFGLYSERRLERNHGITPGTARMYSMAFGFMIFMIIMKSCMIGIAMALAR